MAALQMELELPYRPDPTSNPPSVHPGGHLNVNTDPGSPLVCSCKSSRVSLHDIPGISGPSSRPISLVLALSDFETGLPAQFIFTA